MATRRRTTSSTRSTSRSRTSRSRSRTGYTTRRRTPKVSTRLGGAVAVAAVALLGKLSWGARIGLIVLILLLVVGYELWSRRAQIADEIAAEQASGQTADQTTGQTTDPTAGRTGTQSEPPAPGAGASTPPGAPS